jgi:lactoylglutathione lyase
MKSITPNLMVKDVAETINYYRQLLGFEPLAMVPETSPYNWAMVQKGDVKLMFQEQKSLHEELPGNFALEPGGTFTIYIDVDDVEAMFKELREDVEIIQKLHTTFYGRKEFTIRDLNGYILTLSGEGT